MKFSFPTNNREAIIEALFHDWVMEKHRSRRCPRQLCEPGILLFGGLLEALSTIVENGFFRLWG